LRTRAGAKSAVDVELACVCRCAAEPGDDVSTTKLLCPSFTLSISSSLAATCVGLGRPSTAGGGGGGTAAAAALAAAEASGCREETGCATSWSADEDG